MYTFRTSTDTFSSLPFYTTDAANITTSVNCFYIDTIVCIEGPT